MRQRIMPGASDPMAGDGGGGRVLDQGGGLGGEGEEGHAVERRAIMERLKGRDGAVVALDQQDRSLDSLQMAIWLEGMILEGRGEVAFVIGGPMGLATEVLQRADCSLFFPG